MLRIVCNKDYDRNINLALLILKMMGKIKDIDINRMKIKWSIKDNSRGYLWMKEPDDNNFYVFFNEEIQVFDSAPGYQDLHQQDIIIRVSVNESKIINIEYYT